MEMTRNVQEFDETDYNKRCRIGFLRNREFVLPGLAFSPKVPDVPIYSS